MEARAAITIGNFDGVHLGHVDLVRAARDAVGRAGRVVAIALDPPPLTLLRPDAVPRPISTFGQRKRWLAEAGADRVERLAPTRDLLGQSPEEFVAGVVAEHRPAVVVEGPDFRFGHGRAGSVETLQQLGEQHGFRTLVIQPVEAVLSDQSIVRASSSMTRLLVASGRVTDAARVLGRPYELVGTVVPGDRRGREIGVPTANLDVADEPGRLLLPADGIYSGLATGPGGAWHPAAISVGCKPTFGASPRLCETHLVGVRAAVDEYGWEIRVRFGRWLRDQLAFDGVDALVDQLHRDLSRAAADAEAVGDEQRPRAVPTSSRATAERP